MLIQLLFQLGFAIGERHLRDFESMKQTKHTEALLKLSSKQNIASQIDHMHALKKDQRVRREALVKQLSSTVILEGKFSFDTFISLPPTSLP